MYNERLGGAQRNHESSLKSCAYFKESSAKIEDRYFHCEDQKAIFMIITFVNKDELTSRL